MFRSPSPNASFFALVVLVSVAFIWLVLPWYGSVLWAVILALLFRPLQVWLERRFGGRRSLAAFVSVLACICIVVIPGVLILAALAREASALTASISSREFDPAALLDQVRAALPAGARHVLSSLNLGDFGDMQSGITSFLENVSQTIATRAFTITQGTAQLFVSFGVMLYLLFFLFRDGPALAATIRRASPLSDHHTGKLIEEFEAVMRATVKGNIIIAVIQGTIGGLAFAALGIRAALLWGVLMALLSLVPAVGASLVWLPVSLYLLISGEVLRGVALMLVGMLVISLIDNFLRPPLVGKSTRLPDYLVLLSTVGGLTLVGVNGFVIGPLIAALFVAVWSLYMQDRSSDGGLTPPPSSGP